jgi:hypothetical protein
MNKKYAKPARDDTILHPSWVAAYVLAVGVTCGMWKRETIIISRMIWIANLTDENLSGMSGLSSARVAAATAVLVAEDSAENAEMRTQVSDAALAGFWYEGIGELSGSCNEGDGHEQAEDCLDRDERVRKTVTSSQ